MAPPHHQLLTQVARMFPDALFYAPTQAPLVALTIDDVPTPGDRDDTSTRLILTALDRHNRTAEHPVRAVVEDLQLRLAWLNLDLLWAALLVAVGVLSRVLALA